FGLSYGRYETTYGIPIDPDEPDEEVFIDQHQDRFDLAGRLEKPAAGLRSISVRAGYNDYNHIEFEGPHEPGTVFKNKAWEGRLEFNHEPLGPLAGTFGMQYVHRSFNATGEEAFVQPSTQSSAAVFLFEDTDWRDWHFETSARFEHQGIEPSAIADVREIDHNVYSVSGGALWNFRPDYTVGLTATRGQRPPALVELLADGPHFAIDAFQIGDPGLDAETSNNLDLSLRKTDGRLTWHTSVFVNLIDDFIFQQSQDANGDGVPDRVDADGNPGGDLLVLNFTQANALFYGAEGEVLYGIFDNANGSLDARLFGDWVRGQLTDGPDLPRISPARLGLGLNYQRGPFQANIEPMQVFTQDNTAPLETDTDGYTMLNASASYTLSSAPAEVKLFLRATNLLDENARRATSFIKDRAPLQGRSAIVGINAQF
ncbi:MAG: TonB-dependent receptor, partial [Nitrococcus sp.]|nr:TonB-dependent receptor [Nitrococcus sp.]